MRLARIIHAMGKRCCKLFSNKALKSLPSKALCFSAHRQIKVFSSSSRVEV